MGDRFLVIFLLLRGSWLNGLGSVGWGLLGWVCGGSLEAGVVFWRFLLAGWVVGQELW